MWRRSIVTAAALVFFWEGRAAAHAFLDRAEPPVEGTLQHAPAEIRLHFNESVEPALSSIRLLKADGAAIKLGEVSVDDAEHAVLKASVPPLLPGVYRVVWRAVSTDTHITEGDYTFTVAP
jgi:methionine-rich copper-binding protein CopC